MVSKLLTGFKHSIAGALAGLALCAAIPAAHAQTKSSEGRDFYVAFSQNLGNDKNLSLFISSKVAASGTITFEATGVKTPFTTQPNQVTRVTLASNSTSVNNVEVSTSMSASRKTLRVQADQDVSVYGLSFATASADAVLAFPVTALGTTYRAVAYPAAPITLGGSIRAPSFLMVVATEDGTTVSIQPSTYSQDTGGAEYLPGFSYSTPLTRGQVVQVYSGDSARFDLSDLTGSLITSNKPVAVFSGAKCAEVPVDKHYCDHLYEQIPPTTTWGQTFFMAPMESRSEYVYRVVADQDGTEVKIDGVLATTLAAGKFYEASASTAKSISTSKPSLVMQYAVSGNVDSPINDPLQSKGDPFMQLIPPSDQYLSDYTIATADSNPASPTFTRNYLSIVAPVTPGSSVPPVVSVNGQFIAAGDFTLSAQQDFFYINKTVQPGSFRVQSNVGLGVNMYGFTNVNSYGYTAGMNFSPVTAINDIKLTPSENVSRWVGTQHCVTALVTDSSNQPLSSIKVDVATSGVNTSLNSVYTNAAGQAPYCYTSTAAGKDTLTLSAGGKSAVSTVLWLEASGTNAPTLTLTPAIATQIVGQQQCVVAKMLDSQSQPIVNLAMNLGATGVNSPAATQASTDNAGEASYCYTGAVVGTDTVTATTGPLSKTAAINWVTPPDAVDDNFGNTPAQTPLTGNVLANDGAAPGNTAVLDSNVQHGTLSLQPDGNFTYTSTGNYTGPESFTYHVNSSTSGNSRVATVVFNIVPKARNDAYSVAAGSVLNQAAPGVLGNDIATNGKAAIATPPSNGSVTLNADGSFVYTAKNGFSGADSFTYTTSDAAGVSAAATVTITSASSLAAKDDNFGNTPAQQPLTGNVLANDGAAPGNTAVLDSNVQHGSLSLQPDGSFTYTSTGNYTGPESFTYHLNSSTAGNSNIAHVVFNVVPNAKNDAYSITTGSVLNQAAPGVLGNDIATNGKATIATQPNNGSVTLNADGSFVYTAKNGFSGADSFTYTTSDAAGTSAAATVTITVGSLAKPVGAGDNYQTRMGTTLNIASPGVLVNDTGPAGVQLTASVIAAPAHGSLTLNPDGSFVYTPKDQFEGTDTFTYVASYVSNKSAQAKAAQSVNSDPVTVTITVTNAVTPPVTRSVTPVPSLGPVGLLFLSALVLLAPALRRRQQLTNGGR